MLLSTNNDNVIEYYTDGSGVITYPNGIRQTLSVQEVEELRLRSPQFMPTQEELRYENT